MTALYAKLRSLLYSESPWTDLQSRDYMSTLTEVYRDFPSRMLAIEALSPGGGPPPFPWVRSMPRRQPGMGDLSRDQCWQPHAFLRWHPTDSQGGQILLEDHLWAGEWAPHAPNPWVRRASWEATSRWRWERQRGGGDPYPFPPGASDALGVVWGCKSLHPASNQSLKIRLVHRSGAEEDAIFEVFPAGEGMGQLRTLRRRFLGKVEDVIPLAPYFEVSFYDLALPLFSDGEWRLKRELHPTLES